MNLWQQYIRPSTVSEAVQALLESPGTALPLAGGTDLMLDLQQGRHEPVHTIVDLANIPELRVLEMRANELFIGAGVPLSRVARDALTAQHALALVEACDLIGGPQVRNVATLGGNVAHALPAADGTIALLALGAQAEVAGKDGRRRVPLAELFLGPGKSSLQRGELLVGFHIQALKISKSDGASQASCFKRVMRPQGVALPILNLATWLERKDGRINQLRIAVGPGGPVPFRVTAAEEILTGQPLNAATLSRALEALLAQARFRSSPQRGSADYRRQLVAVLLKETLETAWQRAGAGLED